jgi:hypothetical protein
MSHELRIKLTRSAAPSPTSEGGVKKRRSGSTLSEPWPSGRGVEGLTSSFFSLYSKYLYIAGGLT